MSLSQIAALGLTLAVEAPLVTVVAYWRGIRWQRGLAAGLLASCLTHPFAWKLSWWASTLFATPHYFRWFVAIEAAVCLVEALVFRRILHTSWAWSVGLSVVANAASSLLGVLLWR